MEPVVLFRLRKGDMDKYKIDNFLSDNPDLEFSIIEPLEPTALYELRMRIIDRLGLSHNCDGLTIVKAIDSSMRRLPGLNADSSDFDVSKVLLDCCGAKLEQYLYINWYRMDRVDRILCSEFIKNFDYIWYPGVDDIDVIDPRLGWCFSIVHCGEVKVWQDLITPI